jgi:C4-dicarboxylate-specific signal transduction histidine kinase
LNRKVPDLDQARVSLQSIVELTHRADDVVKSIRAMFRDEAKVRAEVNLSEVVRQVLALTSRNIRTSKIELRTNLADNPPPVIKGDPVQLQQVVLNLVNNAVEAMVASDHWPRVLGIETRIGDDGMLYLAVADTGPGFDAKVSADMFRPFVTTKALGMGMGLSICKTIVEQHGGQLTVASVKPHGALATIAFPAVRGE